METKIITIQSITPRQVTTKFGQKNVYNIVDSENNRYTCWDKEYAESLKPNESVEINYREEQKGQYLNRTIVAPDDRSLRDEKVMEALRKIWQEIQVVKSDVKTILGTTPKKKILKKTKTNLDDIELWVCSHPGKKISFPH